MQAGSVYQPAAWADSKACGRGWVASEVHDHARTGAAGRREQPSRCLQTTSSDGKAYAQLGHATTVALGQLDEEVETREEKGVWGI